MNKLIVCPYCNVPCISLFLIWDYEADYSQQVPVQANEEGVYYSSSEPTTQSTIHRKLRGVRIQCASKGCGKVFNLPSEWDIDLKDSAGRAKVTIREATSKMQEVL